MASIKNALRKIRLAFGRRARIKKFAAANNAEASRPLCRALKKGMYLRFREEWAKCNLSWIAKDVTKTWDYEERCHYMLVTEVLMDENGFVKFQYIAPTQLGWTEWLSPEIFNRRYEVKNPWV